MPIRTKKNFSIDATQELKDKLFEWSNQFQTTVWLDSNSYQNKYSSFECCLAVEEFTSIKTDCYDAFEKLKEYQSYTNDFIFGYINYDVKNDVEQLNSNNFDGVYFDDLFFFQPQKIITIQKNTIEFNYLKMVDDEIDDDYNTILSLNTITNHSASKYKIDIQKRICKEEYHNKVSEVLKHINRGDIYEANFCQEFYAENTSIIPYQVFKKLNIISTAPFTTFMRVDDKYLMCSSPERYLKKEGSKIISQPIKGTAKRDKNSIVDAKIIEDLQNDEKERAENIMIVDLVRNDLSKTAKRGSVNVEELCKVYSFKQVHQSISTVVSEIEHTTHPVDVIKDTFPMGSMTGAPKVSAMKIIEKLEATKRGLYSGAVGYFTPDDNFDFNVVIRSILYNATSQYVSFSVGSAITAKSEIEKEYQECLLKAKAMFEVLTS